MKLLRMAGLALVLLSSQANAGLISQSLHLERDNLFGDGEYVFQPFDTSLGDLTQIYMSFGLFATKPVSEIEGCPAIGVCAVDIFFATEWDTGSASTTLFQNTGHTSLPGPDGSIFASTSGVRSFLAGCDGCELFTTRTSTLSWTSDYIPPGGRVGPPLNIFGNATLTYEFDEVPAPATLALFALALTGVARARHWGKSS